MLFGHIVPLLSIAIIGVHGVTEEHLEMKKMLRQHCLAESGVDEELIVQANQKVLQPDPQLKCYIKCLMATPGILTDKGVDEDLLVSLIPEEYQQMYIPPIKNCGTVWGADLCETAFATHHCYLQFNPEIYHLP